MPIQLDHDSAVCEIVILSIKLSTMNNQVKEIWDLFWRLVVQLFGFARYVFSLNLVLSLISFLVQSHSRNQTFIKVSWILHCGQGNLILIWYLSDLVLRPEQVGHIVRVGGTYRMLFLILACSTLSVDSLTSQFQFWRTLWPFLF